MAQLAVLQEASDARKQLILSPGLVGIAVLLRMDEVRHRPDHGIRHHRTAAVHGFIDDSSPAFLAVAGDQIDLCPLHSFPHFGRLLKSR